MKYLSITQKIKYLFGLERVVKEAGEQILAQRGARITDTRQYKGHESSTIDDDARERVQAALERHLPDFEGTVRFELRPFTKKLIEAEKHTDLVLIIDEIEGTTNTKRCLSSTMEYRPLALVSIGLSLSRSLKDLIIGVVYTLDQGEVFSALKVESDFLIFQNRKIIDPKDVIDTRGDSKKRVLVIGYSNSHRQKKGELEQALYDKGLRVYEGCRASGMDAINLLRNSADAYIDLRTFWSTKDSDGQEKEAMLEVYDIAGTIPILEGCGLKITDAEGEPWQKYELEDAMPLVISRPDIHQTILETIHPLVEKWKGGK